MSAKTWALLLASALVCDHLVTRLLPGTGSHQAKGTGPSRFIAPRDYSTKVVVHPLLGPFLTSGIFMEAHGAGCVSRELPHATSCTWATPGLCI